MSIAALKHDLQGELHPEMVSIVTKSPVPKRRQLSPIESRVVELLESHGHFRGKTQFIQCRVNEGCLRLDGCLPSYYLKQLAQEALRNFPGIEKIDNRIFVVRSLEDRVASEK